MPQPLPELRPFQIEYWYAHMKPADRKIWEKFIAEFPDAYDECRYDVHVGSIPKFVDPNPLSGSDGEERLYKRKIDVIAYKENEIDAIELKPRAGSSAIGQVLMYRDLFIKEYKPGRFVRPVIITDVSDTDVLAFAEKAGVKMILIEE